MDEIKTRDIVEFSLHLCYTLIAVSLQYRSYLHLRYDKYYLGCKPQPALIP
jgi:hypothetical protein